MYFLGAGLGISTFIPPQIEHKSYASFWSRMSAMQLYSSVNAWLRHQRLHASVIFNHISSLGIFPVNILEGFGFAAGSRHLHCHPLPVKRCLFLRLARRVFEQRCLHRRLLHHPLLYWSEFLPGSMKACINNDK